MNENLKEVRFDRYCKLCKHRDLEESKDPCNECLETPMRDGSVKPEHYEPANSRKKSTL